MQRTFFRKTKDSSHDPESTSLLDKRSHSYETKSPSQILELIKLKRSNKNYTQLDLNIQHNDPEIKPINLILPKISGTRQTSTRHTKNISRLSDYTQKSDKKSYSKEKQFQYTLDQLEIDEQYQQEELKVYAKPQAISELIRLLPKQKKYRSNENILPLVQFLMKFNPFFKNLSVAIISSLLKVCIIRHFPKGKWIYRKQDPLDSFLIILWGNIRIYNSSIGFKKQSVKGQTLCQQVLYKQFSQNLVRGQSAKSITQCFVVQIEYNTYLKLYENLVLKGHRSQFQTLQALIRRNYILKNSLRNQKNTK